LLFELIFVYLLFVETRGPTLEEIAKIFDGDEAEVAQVDLASVQIASEKAHGIEVSEVENVDHRAGQGV